MVALTLLRSPRHFGGFWHAGTDVATEGFQTRRWADVGRFLLETAMSVCDSDVLLNHSEDTL